MIPNLRGLTGLTHLDLSRNRLTGPVPAWLGGLTALQQIYLQDNELSGSIPDLSGLTGLTHLDLSRNGLTGPIPAWLNGLTALTWAGLWLNGT